VPDRAGADRRLRHARGDRAGRPHRREQAGLAGSAGLTHAGQPPAGGPTARAFSGPRRQRGNRRAVRYGHQQGAVAQLVAHHTGSVGVTGSSPVSSTPRVLLGHGIRVTPRRRTSSFLVSKRAASVRDAALLPFRSRMPAAWLRHGRTSALGRPFRTACGSAKGSRWTNTASEGPHTPAYRTTHRATLGRCGGGARRSGLPGTLAACIAANSPSLTSDFVGLKQEVRVTSEVDL